MPAALQRSLVLLLRPALGFGLLLGLIISAILAIPWFGTVDPARTPRVAEVEEPAPAQPGSESESPPEAEPPPPPAEQPFEIAALLPAEAPVYLPAADLTGGSLTGVRSQPVIGAGVASSLPEIRALGPEHVGATTADAPTLYWFLSGESSVPVEITLTSEQAQAPLLALHLEPPVGAGLHTLRLQQHGVRLEPGVTHRWFVALVPDSGDRLEAGAAVRRAGDAGALAEQLAAAAPEERAHVLAAAGYWYDAFETLTGWIQEEPAAQRLREHRAALLEQVGLAGVAGLLSAPAPPPGDAAAGP